MAHSDSPVHPFDEISAKYQNAEKSPNSVESRIGSTAKNLFDKKHSYNRPPSISPESIDSPALIIDKNLRLIWQNPSAEEQIWPGIDCSHLMQNQNDIFDMLLAQEFQQSVKNWRQWVGFFIQQALLMLPIDSVDKIFNAKIEPHNETLLALLSDYPPEIKPDDASQQVSQNLGNGQIISFRSVGIPFDTGRLIVFQEEREENNKIRYLDSRPAYMSLRKGIQKGGQESKNAFSVIVAQLNNFKTLSCEMLDVEFGQLLRRLSEIAKGAIEQLDGIFSQHEPSKLIGYFLPNDNNSTDTYNVIQCALKLKNQMENFSREWKIKKGWLHSIELNIGIEYGYNHITMVPSSLGDNFIALGNSLCAASFFATMGKDGQIWVSKQIIDHFPQEKLDTLRFGIFRNDHSQQLFIPNCFSRIEDLQSIKSISTPLDESLNVKPVTQVFDILN